jgi:hypothetical protein
MMLVWNKRRHACTSQRQREEEISYLHDGLSLATTTDSL